MVVENIERIRRIDVWCSVMVAALNENLEGAEFEFLSGFLLRISLRKGINPSPLRTQLLVV